jgi:DNA-binding NtrC family response regulator
MSTILVVDDEEIVLRATQRALRLRGFTVVPTVEPSLAVDLVKKMVFDAIVTDVSMPGMNGFEMKEAICRIRPDMVEKFIFVSGGGDTPLLQTCLSTVKYLQKPYALDDLVREIRRITGNG